uniref:Uncharacterized protein n=1 Tax=Aplanochytrium stocchinoi TaxID=215587 RepID=A0A7S3PR63_9STRA|mmetsp:Transcript_9342/g.10841  ORF Transcript_9342/g.10841 Transcript_9342/m.10841 type:complete len:746 (+) Transcript_9342:172-2409(+)
MLHFSNSSNARQIACSIHVGITRYENDLSVSETDNFCLDEKLAASLEILNLNFPDDEQNKKCESFCESLREASEILKNATIIGNDEESNLLVKLLLNLNLPLRLVDVLDSPNFEKEMENGNVDNKKRSKEYMVDVFQYLLKFRSSPLVSSYIKTYAQELVLKLAEKMRVCDAPRSDKDIRIIEREREEVYSSILRSCVSNEYLWKECFANNLIVLHVLFQKQLTATSDRKLFEEENVKVESELPPSFSVLSKLLTCKGMLFAKFLDEQENQDQPGTGFFEWYNMLLKVENVSVLCHSLRLLSHILLDRNNGKHMVNYISDKENLLLIIYLMVDNNPAIVLEAFHVFKIFVMNPNKSGVIMDTLAQNRRKLVRILKKIVTTRDDPNFSNERLAVAQTLFCLTPQRLPSREPIVTEQRLEEVSRILFGNMRNPGNKALTGNLEESRLLGKLILLGDIPFRILESFTTLTSIRARNNASQILNFMLTWKDEDVYPLLKRYLSQNASSMVRILTLHCAESGLGEIYLGIMKNFMKHRCLLEQYMKMDFFHELYKYLNGTTHNGRENAFETLEHILLQKDKVVNFLISEYVPFFSFYFKLLRSEYDDIQRRSIRLLSTILLEPNLYMVMVKFVSSKTNLRQTMKMMLVGCPIMRFDAFHVFKVFVANPSKPDQITRCLSENRDSLISYLEHFATEEQEHSEVFRMERSMIINILSGLPQLPRIESKRLRNFTSCSSTVTTNSSNSSVIFA